MLEDLAGLNLLKLRWVKKTLVLSARMKLRDAMQARKAPVLLDGSGDSLDSPYERGHSAPAV
jgi:hypothetical protein